MQTINKTHTFLFTTWVNIPNDDIRIYKGSDGKLYGKRFGLPLDEMKVEWAMYLTWMHINRTSGWPCEVPEGGTWIDRRVSISQEAQDFQCKMLLKLN